MTFNGSITIMSTTNKDGQPAPTLTVAEVAQKFQKQYGLTYRCTVNLEGTIFNMLHAGISMVKIEDFIADLYDNFEVAVGN